MQRIGKTIDKTSLKKIGDTDGTFLKRMSMTEERNGYRTVTQQRLQEVAKVQHIIVQNGL